VVYDYKRKKHLQTIRIVPDDLWEEIKLLLPPEKPNKTIGRPVVPFRKVLNGIVYILRTGCQWKVPVQHAIGDSKSGQYLKYFKNCG
jgi:transposase